MVEPGFPSFSAQKTKSNALAELDGAGQAEPFLNKVPIFELLDD